jgi:hypothetical protein
MTNKMGGVLTRRPGTRDTAIGVILSEARDLF